MNIRKANKKDIKDIIRFQLAMAKETEHIELDLNILSQGVESLFEKKHLGQYYIAEDEGKIIGSFMITYEWSDWRNGIVLWFQSVYVLPEYRGKKVFRSMYEYISKLIKSDDSIKGLRLYVDVSNIHAQKVYEGVGMNGDHYKVFEWMKN